MDEMQPPDWDQIPHNLEETLLWPVRGIIDVHWEDPDAPALRYLHVRLSMTRNGSYQGLLTLGVGRGDGFTLAELAQHVTRKLEVIYALPPVRTKWGVRMLSSVATDPTDDPDDQEAIARLVARTDLFRVEHRGETRLAVATTAKGLERHFDRVNFLAVPLPPRNPKHQF